MMATVPISCGVPPITDSRFSTANAPWTECDSPTSRDLVKLTLYASLAATALVSRSSPFIESDLSLYAEFSYVSAANVWGVDTVAYFNQYSSSDGFKWDGPHQISNGIAGANYDSVSFMDVDGYVITLTRKAVKGTCLGSIALPGLTMQRV